MSFGSKILVFLFFLLSGVTWLAAEDGGGIMSRLTFADICGAALISWVILFYRRQGLVYVFPYQFRIYLIFLIFYVTSIFLSDYPERGVFEFVIHFFIFLVGLSLLNIMTRSSQGNEFSEVLQMILVSGGLLALVGIIQFFFVPTLFQGVHGGLSGTFRNTGQAGAFWGVYLALVVPGFFLGIIRRNAINSALIGLMIIALIFTFKRAAQIGFSIGFVLFLASVVFASGAALRARMVTYFILFSVAIALLGSVAFSWGIENIPGMQERVERKINVSAVDDFSEGFLAENINATLQAFSDAPVFGVGPGNVAGIYMEKHEIHSSYLKIVATTGVLGSLAYAFFMVFFYLAIRKYRRMNSMYGKYLYFFSPFFIGLLVSWGYTYHLRKREFWILFAVISFCILLAKKFSPRDEVNPVL